MKTIQRAFMHLHWFTLWGRRIKWFNYKPYNNVPRKEPEWPEKGIRLVFSCDTFSSSLYPTQNKAESGHLSKKPPSMLRLEQQLCTRTVPKQRTKVTVKNGIITVSTSKACWNDPIRQTSKAHNTAPGTASHGHSFLPGILAANL